MGINLPNMNKSSNSTANDCCCQDVKVSELFINTTLYLINIVMPIMAFFYALLSPQSMLIFSTYTNGRSVGKTINFTDSQRITNETLALKLYMLLFNRLIRKNAYKNLNIEL